MLSNYQNRAYAERYKAFVEKVHAGERKNTPGMAGVAEGVARYYYKLLAYKDEYEVARLFTNGEFSKQLQTQFEGDFKVQFHMAPPLLANKDSVTGFPKKITFGSWILRLLRLVAKLKFLRGSVFDPFARSDDRKLERQLIREYESVVEEAVAHLNAQNHRIAVELVCYPESIRGYGYIKKRHVHETRDRVEELIAAIRHNVTDLEAA